MSEATESLTKVYLEALNRLGDIVGLHCPEHAEAVGRCGQVGCAAHCAECGYTHPCPTYLIAKGEQV